MSKKHIYLGQKGEEIAVSFLQSNGYKIIDRNVRNIYGEIDAIARDGNIFCFIEVKMRDSDVCGSGVESITKRKQKKISNTAMGYVQDKKLEDVDMRFDVVSIDPSDDGSSKIELIKNAFDVEV